MTETDHAEANPYEAPNTKSRGSTRPLGDFVKWLYLVFVVTGPALLYLGGATHLTLLALFVCALVCWALALAWFCFAWASVPEDDRHGTKFGRYSLFWAFMRRLLPVYSLYWRFTSLGLLCGAINHSLEKREMPMRASTLLGCTADFGLLGAELWFLLIVLGRVRGGDGVIFTWFAAAVLWFLFMLQADHARRFMVLACLAERERNEATRQALKNAAAARGAATRDP